MSGFTSILVEIMVLFKLKNHIRKCIGGTNCAGGQSARLHRQLNWFELTPYADSLCVPVYLAKLFNLVFNTIIDKLCKTIPNKIV